jgi:site-specific recombinase XerD
MSQLVITPGLSGDFVAGAKSFRHTLTQEGKSPETIRSYLGTINAFGSFLLDRGMPTAPAAITGEYVRHFLAQPMAPASARLRYQGLRRWFLYLVAEGELRATPMANVKPITVPDSDAGRPFVSDASFEKMLATCRKRRPPSFLDRRDLAILLVLRSSGMRRLECTMLRLGDIDTDMGMAIIARGKGGDTRRARFSTEATVALIRYIEARKPRSGGTDRLWVGLRGTPLSATSLGVMVERRGRMAGVGHVTPHQLRHAFAHDLKAKGASDEDLMALGGWRNRNMVARYGKAARWERASDTYDRLVGG